MNLAVEFVRACLTQADNRHGTLPAELAITPRAVAAMTAKFKAMLPSEVDGVPVRCLTVDEINLKEPLEDGCGYRVLLTVVDNGVWHALQLVDTK